MALPNGFADVSRANCWDGDDSFLPYTFAQQVVRHSDFATDRESGTVYHHTGRIWDDNGEEALRRGTRNLFQNDVSNRDVNEVVRNVQAITSQPIDDIFDLPAHKLVVKNGVLNLRTGELEQHRAPGTRVWLDVPYDPDASPDDFEVFLYEILPASDVPVMWEVIGYLLYRGYPFQKAFMLLGEGANGKSTLLRALREFLGQRNCASVSLHDLVEGKYAAASLEGALANLAPDLDARDAGASGKLKALTGGDTVQAREIYEDSFEFQNMATLVFPANRMPASPDETDAYRRRWHYFKFPNSFDDDDAVPQEQLLAQFEDEHAGILARAVEAFRRLWDRGQFEDTSYMDAHDDVHARSIDPTDSYIRDYLDPAPGGRIPIADAYDHYQSWCAENGHSPKSKWEFIQAVEGTHAPTTRQHPADKRQRVWCNLSLSTDD